MSGFGAPFTIYRKRNSYAFSFLSYFDAVQTEAQQWPDRSDNAIELQNGSTTGADADDAQLQHIGYRMDGGELLSGNLNVNAATITEFTIACVITRNESGNNDAAYYGLFGSTHYPRLYCTGTTLYAEIKLDGNVKQVSVADVDDYITPGKPAFIVFRGSVDDGIEVLIDNVSRGTQTDTGTSFDVGSGDFVIGQDTNLSYEHSGEIRMVSVLDQKMTDVHLSTFLSMLEYEGTLDIWFDKHSKWTGGGTLKTNNAPQIGDSPYVGTAIEIES